MKILIVDNGTKYLHQLVRLTKHFDTRVISYSELSDGDRDGYDLIILSGGHGLPVVGHEADYDKELNLIKNTITPILGICFGFELIAHAYGATMARLEAQEKNILHISKVIDDPLFNDLADLRVYENHRWIVTDVGDHLMTLARSRDGIEIIKHKDKLVYGFQFHPEMFEDETQGYQLFANFIKIVQNNYL